MSYKYCVDDESGGAGRNTKPLGSSVLLKYSSLGVGSCACTVILHTARATATQKRGILVSFVLILCDLKLNKFLSVQRSSRYKLEDVVEACDLEYFADVIGDTLDIDMPALILCILKNAKEYTQTG